MPGNPRPRTNRPVPLADLAATLAVEPPPDGGDTPQISGITHASGEVRPGDLYAALPGARRHGAEFVAAAAEQGAVAVLTDPAGAPAAARAGLPALVVPDPRAVLGPLAARVYGEPSRQLAMIGLTGTAGKTSTAYLVESGLWAAGQVTGLIGTVETRLGDLVVTSARTTPEATDLHAMLAVARERGVHGVVMEVSSHALALDRVGGVRFAVGGYTNFGSDHLDFHRDPADYFAAKARLFDGRCAVEILNFDDPALDPLRRPTTITYSAAGNAAATWRATAISDDGYQQHFIVLGPDGISIEAGVGLPGRHNVANALLAIATLVAVGVDPTTAAAGVAACPGVPGRLERVDAPGPVLGVVDYAHKPDAIVAALAALRGLSGARRGRLICLIGAGGDRDRGKRPTMGAAAARGADLVIVTDDNPRSEDPAAIRAEVRRGADQVPGVSVVEIAGRRAAIDEAVRLADAGDVIAVLGKGHEQGQEIDGATQPFDDRTELTEALAARFAALAGRS
ncbi:UDP-N-acetylmuramoyl-L-alanyl-D-glutamate--2,6-diaminopimelate ligase [Solwaraspora sp. WMMD406]|uniref:UDP-N-acetylmuramoyl-L-alanyl-D-glutamate--2, 6-diaminopimelate ligase n=1 Tax=Solwaraspora sp. WMMD406 TaxID=3016095 RepID=UPI002415FE66|nr:UDP-N-acetylmuramoyl-L-alanyl-D-glutamate--2,6-diaminopimelate ligase [Solwaraspora sp. WMMD406]MDG4765335.1 UDP-N-acetylmuramoyl-L-alanyl-D-glutamate--2,6-diaminopimelate ligase [Solwaraspora sp. WMMD406]